jgi:choline monooxygenase
VDQSTLETKLEAFRSDLTLARASTIPATWYSDPEIYELERRGVFHDSWQALGRADQVAEPGQFFTAELAGEPVLVVRDKEGTLRALANVCRHRAARIERREGGQASRFRCRYHGWAYDLKGNLAGTPEFDGVEDFCKEALSLPRYHVDVWGPFVFVHLGTPAMTLTDYMRPIAERSGDRGLASLKFGGRRTYEMACNWKLFVDNYLDGGYHINTLHPDLAKVVNMDTYHTVLDDWASVQISPLRTPPASRVNADLGVVRTGAEAHYWWLYPNFMINLYDGTMDTNLVLPLGPDRCLCLFDFYFTDVESPEARAYIEKSAAVAHQVQLEDQDICEEVQRGLSSRSYASGRFSVRREAGGLHFHVLLAEALRRQHRQYQHRR